MVSSAFNSSVFEKFPVLRTPRLLLRSLEIKDADALLKLRSDPGVNRFIARPAMSSATEALELINRVLAGYDKKESVGWVALLRGSGDIIGGCGFKRIEAENRRAEIGGELHTSLWGKGVAQEAFGAIVKYGLEVMNLHSIEAQLWPGNRSAIALLEKHGFVKEGHLRECMHFNGKFIDRAIYSLVRKEGPPTQEIV